MERLIGKRIHIYYNIITLHLIDSEWLKHDIDLIST